MRLFASDWGAARGLNSKPEERWLEETTIESQRESTVLLTGVVSYERECGQHGKFDVRTRQARGPWRLAKGATSSSIASGDCAREPSICYARSLRRGHASASVPDP